MHIIIYENRLPNVNTEYQKVSRETIKVTSFQKSKFPFEK